MNLNLAFPPDGGVVPRVDLRGIDLERLAGDQQRQLLRLASTLNHQMAGRKFEYLFSDIGRYPREAYPRHMTFFSLGVDCRERAFIAANRVGKTVAGAFETTCHLTGRYPEWWEGKRFGSKISAWACGNTYEDVRDILQLELFGQVIYDRSGRKRLSGTGVVPRNLIDQRRIRWKSGSDLVDTVYVRHVSGEWSKLGFKSYAQGRKTFQGTSRHLIWLDEECPMDVYDECLIRTATTNGIVFLTFTPLLGLTPLVRSFLPDSYGAR